MGQSRPTSGTANFPRYYFHLVLGQRRSSTQDYEENGLLYGIV
jgi:hypothetical protein